jgi:hypothetical protein
VIDHHRAIRAGKKFAEMHRVNGSIAGVETCRALLKQVILHRRAFRKFAAERGDAFTLAH